MRMVHGTGAISELGSVVAELGVRRPLLVTDSVLAEIGLVERALSHLPDAALFADVYPNPDIELVGRASAAYREHGCDGLVALGGGSSMDTAKSVGVEIVHGGSIAEYEYGGAPLPTPNSPPLAGGPPPGGGGGAHPRGAG